MNSFSLKNRDIGPDSPVYFIAEMSANHAQDYDTAVQIIKAAADAGADAIKLQTYRPDTMTLDCDNDYFRIESGSEWDNQTLHELYEKAYTPWDWQSDLQQVAQEHGLDFFSTAFDESSADFLDELGVPVHKTGSFELVDLPLIERLASSGKPLIMSTGMGSLGEIEEAVKTARNAGAEEILLLYCVSSYPAEPDQMNLRTIPHLSETFDVPVGLSDHTLGTTVPVVASSLGACMVEKHFTVSRDLESPDSHFSLEPDEFGNMVESVRMSERTLGGIHYGKSGQETQNTVFRRSIFVAQNMEEGETFTNENIRRIRPGHGLHPRYYNEVIGAKAAEDLNRGTPLTWNLVMD